jgi:hypothetical protein
MNKPLLMAALAAAASIASPIAVATADTPAATVSHYTASYPCPCFGQFDLAGVHVTNARFSGLDDGPFSTATTGGRDNFSGTVTQPPQSEVVLTDVNAGEWCSDYDQARLLCTTTWSETIEPDGSVTGWAVYPNGA